MFEIDRIETYNHIKSGENGARGYLDTAIEITSEGLTDRYQEFGTLIAKIIQNCNVRSGKMASGLVEATTFRGFAFGFSLRIYEFIKNGITEDKTRALDYVMIREIAELRELDRSDVDGIVAFNMLEDKIDENAHPVLDYLVYEFSNELCEGADVEYEFVMAARYSNVVFNKVEDVYEELCRRQVGKSVDLVFEDFGIDQSVFKD